MKIKPDFLRVKGLENMYLKLEMLESAKDVLNIARRSDSASVAGII